MKTWSDSIRCAWRGETHWRRVPVRRTLRADGLRAGLVAGICVVALLGSNTPIARAQARGELLYENSCKACHEEQVHWRSNSVVTDWSSLEAQVRRWQSVGRLNWSDDDIRDVARYLNDRIYGVEPKSGTISALGVRSLRRD